MGKYKYEQNTIFINDKAISFNEKIEEVMEFDRRIIVMTEYTKDNPTNNLYCYDNYGDYNWNIEDIIDTLPPQTVVSIGKVNDNCLEVVTFFGLSIMIDINNGQVLEKMVTK
ncbi:hypothetical protein D6853_05700 [Butyrivibrio sp. X503]|uniref:hypothetical protein n=1 Tax=Butyrivibrio sp. X503 TaxID=2364878 RepID=UPI000EA9474C|nr:hypothetical protein [Butyrivibrio sp. X503]RKM56288.1 hypothetical protein D6853_05700 [Butyrivibrio sp. X503]